LIAGGGAVRLVTRDEVVWANAEDRSEAGSPNVVGAVALATAIVALEHLGYEAIASTEDDLLRQLLLGIGRLPHIRVLGSADPRRVADRLGVVSFVVEGWHHAALADWLSREWGIGVRDGCFCAHPYVTALLRLDAPAVEAAKTAMVAGNRAASPGAVRVSLAPYNQAWEVARLLDALRESAVANGPRAWKVGVGSRRPPLATDDADSFSIHAFARRNAEA
jgi:selenocysteine lyase/cysteine desulfurase